MTNEEMKGNLLEDLEDRINRYIYLWHTARDPTLSKQILLVAEPKNRVHYKQLGQGI